MTIIVTKEELQLGISAVEAVVKWWQERRAAAAQSGDFSAAELATADARFAKAYPDPLGGTTPPLPPPPHVKEPPVEDVTAKNYDATPQGLSDAIKAAKTLGPSGWAVYRSKEGKFHIFQDPFPFPLDPSTVKVWPA